MTGRNILITNNAHGFTADCLMNINSIERSLISEGGVVVIMGVWIEDNVCVLPGVNIGKYSIIGVNAVVTKDIPDYSVMVGAPSKVIKIEK